MYNLVPRLYYAKSCFQDRGFFFLLTQQRLIFNNNILKINSIFWSRKSSTCEKHKSDLIGLPKLKEGPPKSSIESNFPN